MFRVFAASVFGVAILISFASVACAQSADDVLKALDAELKRSNNQFAMFRMITLESGKSERQIDFQATVKGTARRIEFTAPADLKGTKLLFLSATQMYIYLPAFKKVRRVASHVQEQGFMGTAFDYAETSLAVFGEVFAAESVDVKGDSLTLKLRRRPDVDFAHARIEIDMSAERHQPLEIRYFNDKGMRVKTETRRDLVCQGDFCMPREVVMIDHTRSDLQTTMKLVKAKTDPGVPESYFTVRALQRGN